MLHRCSIIDRERRHHRRRQPGELDVGSVGLKQSMPDTEGLSKLRQLEREGRYLFHGSGSKLAELTPRQAYDVVNGERLPDGAPAVFATQFVDYALFMAIINRLTCSAGLRSSCNFKDGKLVFGASSATLAQLDGGATGYVHVLDKASFIQRNDFEWKSHSPVVPTAVIQVQRTDLEMEISIIEENDR